MSTQPDRAFIIPFYMKAAFVLLAAFLFTYSLYIAQEIIVPLLFSMIIAILLNPTVILLTRRKVPRIVAISIAVVAATLIVLGFVYFVIIQVNLFSASVPLLEARFSDILTQLRDWIASEFHVAPQKVSGWVKDIQDTLLSNKTALIGQTFATITGIIFTATLLPVYVWLILFYQPLLLEFVRKLFGRANQAAVGEVLFETKSIIQSYLVGLLIETIIVSAMAAAGLVLLGIDYAILIGIISGLLNLIPYIGAIIAAILPMVLALLTKEDPLYAIWVLALYVGVQFIDNNYIMPKIVASKVKINALVTVIVVIVGGALWGIPGMFLSIPLTAILMVICHRFESLKPWGYLLGVTMHSQTRHPLKTLRARHRAKG